MKYKVGDRVVIKHGLKKMSTREIFVTDEMEKKEGSIVTISRADCDDETYRVAGLHSYSWFEEEMFEPVDQLSCGGVLAELGNGEIVTVNDSDRYMPIKDPEKVYGKMVFHSGTISLTLSNARKNKSGIESRKDIRKRLLKL